MKQLYKNIIITFVIGCIVYVIGTLISGGFDYQNANEFFIDFGFYQLYAFVLGFSNMYFFGYMESRQWKQEDTITIMGLFVLRALTITFYYNRTFGEFLSNESIENYQFGLWVTLTIVIIFHFIYFYNRYQKQKIKEQKVIAGTARAKFDALKNQLDPHFLFNSLNVLTSLIEENPDNAQNFTTSLSKI